MKNKIKNGARIISLVILLSCTKNHTKSSTGDNPLDTTKTFQTMDGFGFALTGGSADVINKMQPADEDALLHELFATDSNAIGISYLRISIGASDLDSSVFTFDDLPTGQTD